MMRKCGNSSGFNKIDTLELAMIHRFNISLLLIGAMLLAGCASPKSHNRTKTCTLPSWRNGAPRLQIEVPTNFRMQQYKGPDFYVISFSNTEKEKVISVYIGHNPSLRTEESGSSDIHRVAGHVGSINVEWLRWIENGQSHTETIVENFYGQSPPPQYDGILLHIFAAAANEQGVKNLEAVAATLRLEKGK